MWQASSGIGSGGQLRLKQHRLTAAASRRFSTLPGPGWGEAFCVVVVQVGGDIPAAVRGAMGLGDAGGVGRECHLSVLCRTDLPGRLPNRPKYKQAEG